MKAYKILLVDDDADDQFFFMDAVNSLKMEVDCAIANNGLEAIHQLSAGSRPSMIFLDLNMPKMNGYECLEEIQHMDNCRDIPIIVMSTSKSARDKEWTAQFGVRKFITKTNDYRELRSQLDEIIRSQIA